MGEKELTRELTKEEIAEFKEAFEMFDIGERGPCKGLVCFFVLFSRIAALLWSLAEGSCRFSGLARCLSCDSAAAAVLCATTERPNQGKRKFQICDNIHNSPARLLFHALSRTLF